MSETIIPAVLMRRGDLVELHGVPHHLPETLGNFEWPKEYAKRFAEADGYTSALYDSHAAWVEAHEEYEDAAPARDQEALEAAIRAGKPDPGTPATEAADRAEHVAWTRLQLALDDARDTTHKAVIAEYLREQTKHLAAHEVAREKAHAEASRKAAAIMAEAEDRANQPGRVSAALKAYVATRWDESDDRDTLLVAAEGDSDTRKRAVAERNAAILARWRREAAGEPEPVVDAIATGRASELGAAAEYGSGAARAELARRRAASRA